MRADSDALTHKQVYLQCIEAVNESLRLSSVSTTAEASPRLRAGRRRLTETYKYSTCRLTEWSVCVVVETGGGVMLFTGETLTIENHVSVKTNSFYFLYKFQLFI